MAGDEEGRFDVVFGEELEHAPHADGAGEEPARNVRGAVFAAVGAEPAGDGVDVDGDAGLDSFVKGRSVGDHGWRGRAMEGKIVTFGWHNGGKLGFWGLKVRVLLEGDRGR